MQKITMPSNPEVIAPKYETSNESQGNNQIQETQVEKGGARPRLRANNTEFKMEGGSKDFIPNANNNISSNNSNPQDQMFNVMSQMQSNPEMLDK